MVRLNCLYLECTTKDCSYPQTRSRKSKHTTPTRPSPRGARNPRQRCSINLSMRALCALESAPEKTGAPPPRLEAFLRSTYRLLLLSNERVSAP